MVAPNGALAQDTHWDRLRENSGSSGRRGHQQQRRRTLPLLPETLEPNSAPIRIIRQRHRDGASLPRRKCTRRLPPENAHAVPAAQRMPSPGKTDERRSYVPKRRAQVRAILGRTLCGRWSGYHAEQKSLRNTKIAYAIKTTRPIADGEDFESAGAEIHGSVSPSSKLTLPAWQYRHRARTD